MAMTEAEWLARADPTVMLEFLPSRASDRKLLLFWVACWRRACESHLEWSQNPLTQVERYADLTTCRGNSWWVALTGVARAAERAAQTAQMHRRSWDPMMRKAQRLGIMVVGWLARPIARVAFARA